MKNLSAMTENQDIVTRELVNTLLNLLLDNDGFGIELFSENYERKVILGNPLINPGWGIYLYSYGGDEIITLGDNSGNARISISKNAEDQSFISINAKDGVAIGQNSGGVRITNLEAPSASTDAVNKAYVDTADANLQAQIDALGEPFRVKNFAASNLNKELPLCTEDISNTSIPNIDVTISGQEATDYQMVGLLAYEIFDANGARINCWPVCQFTQNNQTALRTRWMCAGTSRKIANRINAWVLLKHR